MTAAIDIIKLKEKASLKDRYGKQLQRLKSDGLETECIETAVDGTFEKISSGKAAMVIYGEPQSGKTEMMICLTAKLLDEGCPIIVHLLNDSVDLLSQNLKRFKQAGLAPAAKTSSEIPSRGTLPKELVVFCKKNSNDLQHLISCLKKTTNIVVVDDEADYATPNSEVNKGTKTRINAWIEKLLGAQGKYIGVTATPARLDLNNTFQNDPKLWVRFPTHKNYTGQDVFFPLDLRNLGFRLTRLSQGGNKAEAELALLRFLVTVAYLNTNQSSPQDYTMLVHTSGKRDDHEADRIEIEKAVAVLRNPNDPKFEALVSKVYGVAGALYPGANSQEITEYVVETASRATLIVLNSRRDRKAAGDSATVPTSPFTIIVGGNIVSRGVTFPNLLAMFFTRDVRSKLQQDTYIQRARMFGARGSYLEHFELTIPTQLYTDWHKCFVYHRLSLASIANNLSVPVWMSDSRVSVASGASIDRRTVELNKGEMSFGLFKFTTQLDKLVEKSATTIDTLRQMQEKIREHALPTYLINVIETAVAANPNCLAIHTASSIVGYKASANQEAVYRKKNFIGTPQLEAGRFPNATHHIKIFYNAEMQARVFFKVEGGMQFMSNERDGTH